MTANLPISREGQFITVPRDAVLLRPAGAVVWYAQAMGGPLPAAFPEPVTVLFGVGGRYAVEPLPGGAFPALTAGTQVVIEGAELKNKSLISEYEKANAQRKGTNCENTNE
ncbi:MAG: hypothetical protein JKY60_03965 [Kordiimonadaceae bacterium]|nr:hypothetical protein [Kordiimonadaceae bacterium]